MGKHQKLHPQKSARTDATCDSRLKDAQTLQQRAERRKDSTALAIYEQAASNYRSVLEQTEAGAEDKSSARFGLGETLQLAAELTLTCSCAAEDTEVRAAEAAAAVQARAMLSEAIQHYQQVKGDDGLVRVDALVNCGNALATLAEVENPSNSLAALEKAAAAYQDALAREEDALTFSNLADALVSNAEHLQRAGLQLRSRQIYGEAMTAYAKACSMSSSEEGDDLPGLLHNWGIGLHSAGVSLKDTHMMSDAIGRLKDAAAFNRGDVAVLNALGDALFALADLSGPALTQEILERALQEGFQAALLIDRNQSDALIGVAEVNLQLGRLGSGSEAAKKLFAKSAAAYEAALRHPTRLGGFKDRSEIRYNYACAACLSGDVHGAEAMLRALMAAGGAEVADIVNDPDLKSLHSSQLFAEVAA